MTSFSRALSFHKDHYESTRNSVFINFLSFVFLTISVLPYLSNHIFLTKDVIIGLPIFHLPSYSIRGHHGSSTRLFPLSVVHLIPVLFDYCLYTLLREPRISENLVNVKFSTGLWIWFTLHRGNYCHNIKLQWSVYYSSFSHSEFVI